VLARESDGPLIPDFFLQPLDGDFCDILDLKLPTSNLIVGSKNRFRLSSSVAEAVAQGRDYGNYFEDPQYRSQVRQKYGLTAYKPQLFVVIGRSPSTLSPEGYRRVVSGNSDVKLMTYDDLQKRIAQMISLAFPPLIERSDQAVVEALTQSLLERRTVTSSTATLSTGLQLL